MSQDVLHLAEQIRGEFEEGKVEPAVLEVIYEEYNPEAEDAKEIAQRTVRSFPQGAGALATLYVLHRFSAAGLDHGIPWQGSYYDLKARRFVNHTFALMNLGSKVDITADTFPEGPRVSVGPVENPWSLTSDEHPVVKLPPRRYNQAHHERS